MSYLIIIAFVGIGIWYQFLREASECYWCGARRDPKNKISIGKRAICKSCFTNRPKRMYHESKRNR